MILAAHSDDIANGIFAPRDANNTGNSRHKGTRSPDLSHLSNSLEADCPREFINISRRISVTVASVRLLRFSASGRSCAVLFGTGP